MWGLGPYKIHPMTRTSGSFFARKVLERGERKRSDSLCFRELFAWVLNRSRHSKGRQHKGGGWVHGVKSFSSGFFAFYMWLEKNVLFWISFLPYLHTFCGIVRWVNMSYIIKLSDDGFTYWEPQDVFTKMDLLCIGFQGTTPKSFQFAMPSEIFEKQYYLLTHFKRRTNLTKFRYRKFQVIMWNFYRFLKTKFCNY